MRLEQHQAFRDLISTILARIVIFIKPDNDIRKAVGGTQRILVPWGGLAVTVAERCGYMGRKARSYWLRVFFHEGKYTMGGSDPRGSKSIRFLDHLSPSEAKARAILRIGDEDKRNDEVAALAANNPGFHRAVKDELRRLRARKFINVPDKFRDLLADSNLSESAMPVVDLATIMPKMVVVGEVEGYDKMAMAPRVLKALREATVVEAEGVSGMAIPHPCGQGELEFYGGQDGLPENIGLGSMDMSSVEGMLLTVDPRVVQIISLAIWSQIQATGVIPLEMLPAGDRKDREDRTYFDVTDLMQATKDQGHAGFLMVRADQREQLVLRDGACTLDLSTSSHREEAEERLQAAEASRREDMQARNRAKRTRDEEERVQIGRKAKKEAPAEEVVPVDDTAVTEA